LIFSKKKFGPLHLDIALERLIKLNITIYCSFRIVCIRSHTPDKPAPGTIGTGSISLPDAASFNAKGAGLIGRVPS
jgi:hypothetical protein